jgi:hypothetical protein
MYTNEIENMATYATSKSLGIIESTQKKNAIQAINQNNKTIIEKENKAVIETENKLKDITGKYYINYPTKNIVKENIVKENIVKENITPFNYNWKKFCCF